MRVVGCGVLLGACVAHAPHPLAPCLGTFAGAARSALMVLLLIISIIMCMWMMMGGARGRPWWGARCATHRHLLHGLDQAGSPSGILSDALFIVGHSHCLYFGGALELELCVWAYVCVNRGKPPKKSNRHVAVRGTPTPHDLQQHPADDGSGGPSLPGAEWPHGRPAWAPLRGCTSIPPSGCTGGPRRPRHIAPQHSVMEGVSRDNHCGPPFPPSRLEPSLVATHHWPTAPEPPVLVEPLTALDGP